MTTATLLQNFRHRGIDLYLAGEKLRYRAKPGALTQEDRDLIRENRAAIVEALQVRCDNKPSHCTCADCSHFQRDTIGDGSGLGRCTQGHGWYWPREWHVCQSWLEVGHG